MFYNRKLFSLFFKRFSRLKTIENVVQQQNNYEFLRFKRKKLEVPYFLIVK